MKKFVHSILAGSLLVSFLHISAGAQPTTPSTLGELNAFDLSFTDLSSNFDISASVPLFTAKASRKNHNVVLNFLKYKDVIINGVKARVFAGMQLYITSYNYSYSGSVTPASISAAATLGKTKATFDLKIHGLPIDYSKLPKTGSFNADSFAQIEKAFDDILNSLTEKSVIAPMIVKLPPNDNTAIFQTMKFADIDDVITSKADKTFDSKKVQALQ
jgi:hypothetical protein